MLREIADDILALVPLAALHGHLAEDLADRGPEPLRPINHHEKRPIEGFSCHRSEVSGKRLWGFAEERFKAASAFFRDFFVWNYCPLAFMEVSGKNFTPDKLPPRERDPLFAICDQALVEVVHELRPSHVIGVGAFAEKRVRLALADLPIRIGSMLHPSPASP